jgi:WS/DGAT/MGAT family acyltransferase
MPPARREPFAPVDAAWLRMEDPTNLMMITGVLMFDQLLDFERLKATIERRLLARFDRFRKRVVADPARLGAPAWELDPTFTLAAHMHRVALPAPGDQRALETLVSDLMSSPLDFSKPLWQFHLVEGYGDGCALVARLHHAIADGIALVHVLLSLTDSDAAGDPAIAKQPDNAGQSAGVARWWAGLQHNRELLMRETQGLFEHPERLGELARTGLGGALALNKLVFMSSDPQTVLKGRLGVQKLAAWSQPLALDAIKAIGRVTGSTINDVLMAAVAGALRRYLQQRGAPLPADLDVRAVVPVNLRPLDRPPSMGNAFGVVFLGLPLGIEDPYDRLIELRERMQAIKGTPEALVAFGILGVLGSSPDQLQRIGVTLFGSKATLVLTNVPGPRQTIYLAGAPIRSCMFWVPQAGHLGIGVSIFSYAGTVLLGVATDQALIPDPATIIAGFHEEIDTLGALARAVEGGD